MSLKLKALVLSLNAAMAVSAVVATNAPANGAGHFVTTGNSHAHITGFAGPGTGYNLHFSNHGLEGEIGCTTQTYSATTTTETTTSITVTPAVSGCTTTSNGQAVSIDLNGCTFTLTVASNTTDSTEQTTHLLCPTGKKIEVTHPNCTVSIHPQTDGGDTYTTTHDVWFIITKHTHIQLNTTRHGLCQFIAPTNGTGTLSGSVLIKAFNTSGGQISIRAT